MGVTSTTRRLLDYWTREERERYEAAERSLREAELDLSTVRGDSFACANASRLPVAS